MRLIDQIKRDGSHSRSKAMTCVFSLCSLHVIHKNWKSGESNKMTFNDLVQMQKFDRTEIGDD